MKLRQLFKYALFILVAVGIAGCSSNSSLEKANNFYDLYQFNTAVDMYKKILTKERDKKVKAEITMKIAESYRQMSDYPKAESYYRKVVKMPNPDPIAFYYIGDMLKRQEKYEDAIIAFKDYIREMPGEAKGELALKSCEDAIKWKEEKTRYVVENFKVLNNKSNDYAPMFYKKGALVFTSDREESTGGRLYDWTQQKHSDIYVSEPVGKGSSVKYSKPVLIDEDKIVNTNFNEGVVSFDSRFNTMYYTQCNDKDGDGHNCRIFVIRKKGKVWAEPEVLSICKDSFTIYGHPSLSPDGKKLYFVSDMDGGYGGLDIYMTSYVKRGKTWGDPVNLGDVINTAGNEMFPFSYTSNRLYFSSDRHPGLGGLDIFYSDKTDEAWGIPVNMRPPINSGGDDFSIIVEKGGTIARGYSGYFASNRAGKGDDIYRFYMTPLLYTLTGTVFNLKTKETIPDATVTLIINDSAQIVVQTDASGSYKYILDAENEYSVSAYKKFYFDSEIKYVSTVGLEFSEDFVRDLYLDPFLPVDLELEGIYYDLDKYTLRPESMVVLDSLYHIMIKHPYIVIEIGSHTDCRASKEYNQVLSENRAKAVTDYLEYKGIPKDRLQPVGYGEERLANKDCYCEDGEGPGMDCSEAQHQLNRRTTFKIIRTDYQYSEELQKNLEKEQEKLQKPAAPTVQPGKKPVKEEEEPEEVEQPEEE